MVFLLIAMLFLLATAIFVFQNNAVVTVQFLHWSSPELLLAVVFPNPFHFFGRSQGI
jgi:uncharacterized integral membrane protein